MERSFSERLGYAPPRAIQTDGMDGPLRASVWNLIATAVETHFGDQWVKMAEVIARDCLRVHIDAVPGYNGEAREWLLKRYSHLEWYRAYDMLEFVGGSLGGSSRSEFEATANHVLEREMSAFRLVTGCLTRITDSIEVKAIEEAGRAAAGAGLDAVCKHLDEAARQLGRRPEPDYRNAIKEAISAVESAVSAMAGLPKPDLDEALGVLRGRGLIHAAMATAFTKLYGYTSDAGGIRHALLEENAPPVSFDEAKFMVVACSAFCHFLIMKAKAAGLLKKPT